MIKTIIVDDDFNDNDFSKNYCIQTELRLGSKRLIYSSHRITSNLLNKQTFIYLLKYIN
jgi:hypothetical protein